MMNEAGNEMNDLDIPQADYSADTYPPSNTYTNESEEERKIPWLIVCLCVFFIIFFTILCFCTYFIPRSEYIKAKEQHPGLEFLELPLEAEALHWTSYCVFVCFFVSLIVYLIRHNLITLTIMLFLACGCIFFIIYPPISYRLSSVVTRAFDRSYDYTSYERNISEMITQIPCIKLSASGTSLVVMKGLMACTSEDVTVNGTNASTSADLPELGEYAWVRYNLDIRVTSAMRDYLNEWGAAYTAALPDKTEDDTSIDWEYNFRFTLESYNDDYIFVKRKDLSGGLSVHVGNTMFAFWSGVGYIYRLISIPVYRPVITKTNLEFNMIEIPDENDEFWEKVGEIKCVKKPKQGISY